METFGPYQLLDLLGSSDTGEVFRAHDTATDRVVALKVLPAHLSGDAEFAERFRRDGRTVAGLNHPHIVPTDNYGDIDGRLYLDMRLIDGRDLGAVLAGDGALHPARAVAIIEQIAAALDTAHAAGLAHGHLTPANIVVDARDFAYLTGFGAGTGDPHADISALARVLHDCLTGHPPTAPGIPPALGAVIARGMADNPDERYQSATELAYAARAALVFLPPAPSGFPPQAPAKAVSPSVRVARYLTALLAALLGVYLLAASVVALTHTQPSIDTNGGTRVTLTAQTRDGSPPAPDILAEAQQVISSRVDGLGLSGSRVVVDGDNVVVTVPGDNAGKLSGIGQIGLLYIRPVLTTMPAGGALPGQSAPPGAVVPPPPAGAGLTPRIAAAKKLRQSDNKLIQMLALRLHATQCDNDDVLAGYDDPQLPLVTCSTNHTTAYLLGPSLINGDQIDNATSGVDRKTGGGNVVELRFKSDAAGTWADYTATHIGYQTAFTLDTSVVSAPQIQEAIPAGRTRITGDFSQAQARDLANVLNYQPLPLAFKSSAPESIPPQPRSAVAGLLSPPVGLIAAGVAVLLVLIGALAYLYWPAKKPNPPQPPWLVPPAAPGYSGAPAPAAPPHRTGLAVAITTATVVIVAIATTVGYLVLRHPGQRSPQPGEHSQAVRVTSSKLITAPGSEKPKAVVSFYEDYLCPACGHFEKTFAPIVARLIDTGAIAADYYAVALLDRPATQHYSSRAGAAAYCVADESTDVFRRFHATLFTPQMQPPEVGGPYPDNARLIELAEQAGAAGDVADCINSDKYLAMVQDMVKATGIRATPTVKINGEDYRWSTPEALVDKIKEIVGDVPGL